MIEDFIYATLNSSADLAPYRGGGVFPTVAPKKSKGWHLTYQQISEPEQEFDSDPITTRWQINIVAPKGYDSNNYRSGKTAAKIVKSLMTEFDGVVGDVCINQIDFQNQTDISDRATNTFFVAQDYLIKYYEV